MTPFWGTAGGADPSGPSITSTLDRLLDPLDHIIQQARHEGLEFGVLVYAAGGGGLEQVVGIRINLRGDLGVAALGERRFDGLLISRGRHLDIFAAEQRQYGDLDLGQRRCGVVSDEELVPRAVQHIHLCLDSLLDGGLPVAQSRALVVGFWLAEMQGYVREQDDADEAGRF